MLQIFLAILIVLGAILILVLGSGLVVLLAYGIGWLLTRFLPFNAFEATLLSLIGICIFGVIASRIITGLTTSQTPDLDDDDEWDDEDWDDEDDEEEEEEKPEPKWTKLTAPNPSIPKWRQPQKQIDYSSVRPNDLCPCGSGKKFKNCHGLKS